MSDILGPFRASRLDGVRTVLLSSALDDVVGGDGSVTALDSLLQAHQRPLQMLTSRLGADLAVHQDLVFALHFVDYVKRYMACERLEGRTVG